MHAADQAEMEDLRGQLQELQAAVGQAVEDIKARNEAAEQSQATAAELGAQLAARDAEVARLRSAGDAAIGVSSTSHLKLSWKAFVRVANLVAWEIE